MSLSSEQYSEGMKRLRNAFNRTIPNKVIDGWYQEIQDCDGEVFEATIKDLIREDHYPNLGQFWARYHENEHKFGVKEKDQRGCDHCRDGYIHFKQYSHSSKTKFDVVAFCKFCFPEKRSNFIDPNAAVEYQGGMEPWKNRPDVLIPRIAVPDMLRDLHKKMCDPATDWKKEIEDAWKMNNQAIGAHDNKREGWTA